MVQLKKALIPTMMIIASSIAQGNENNEVTLTNAMANTQDLTIKEMYSDKVGEGQLKEKYENGDVEFTPVRTGVDVATTKVESGVETTKDTVNNVVDKVFPVLPLTDGSRNGDMGLLAGEEDIGAEESEVFIAVDPVVEEEVETEEEEEMDMEEEEEEEEDMEDSDMEDSDMEDEDMEEEEEEEDLDMEEEEEEEDLDMEEEEEEEEEDLAIIDSENMAAKVFEDVPVKDKQEESPSSRSADPKETADLPKGKQGKKQGGQELEGNENESEGLLGKQVTTGLYIGAGLVATLVLSVAWKFKSIRRKYNDVSTDENINDNNV